MPTSSEALWAFFVAAAIGLTVLVVALAAALTIAQHRFLGLHKTYGQRLLTAQDEERAWVAREVHDDVVQRLAVLRHELDLARGEETVLTPAQRRRLAGLEGEIEDLGVALRQLAHRLHPSTLDHGDIGLALEQLVEEGERIYGLEVQVTVAVPAELRSTELALAAYRIGQEALRNVSKHAGVTRAEIDVSISEGEVVLQVRDRGCGFDKGGRAGEASGHPRGLGLLTIQERARQVGGTAVIASRPGVGTTVTVTMPINGGTRA
ncbi:MAG TPA: ATP-binding protein [Gemmatimonadales bacterium]|nr:ATP-binding protein [Gemmatimonadales bacterium]